VRVRGADDDHDLDQHDLDQHVYEHHEHHLSPGSGVLRDRSIELVRLGTERPGCSELLRESLHGHTGRGRPSWQRL
jgi:hypothetical protein